MSDQDQTIEMLTTEGPAARGLLRPRLMKAAGVGMAGLLALSACASVEGGDDAEDDGQDQTEAAGEEASEEEAPEEAEVPEFEDLAEDMFDAMEAQDNVTMVGQGAIWDDEFEDLTDEDIEDVEQSFTVKGAMDGETSHMEMEYGDQVMSILVAEGEAFMSGQFVADIFQSEAADYGEEDLVDWDALSSDLEGTWVDMTAELGEGDAEEFSVGFLLEEMREGYEEGTSDSDDIFGDMGNAPEGEADERDGEDVWVYAEDDTEVVVRADEEEPLLLAVNTVDEDGNDVEMTLEDWNESEVEAPDTSDVLSESDFEELLLEHADEELIEQM
ncbi:hypothetical protein ACFP47_08945 [Nesterenkonia lacusekhoensis]|uniref:Uncharacterized protein n=1 Tax=Nesterenkonia lacusekhoensis TaxID=150832 RepID=A0ABS4SZ27_9MICC|nr:hypothetical protein [Nesterenkonia lacusekhoensis]MBP2317457.1 hypothetical protein [Nesterenkonia lacusekhoensis]